MQLWWRKHSKFALPKWPPGGTAQQSLVVDVLGLRSGFCAGDDSHATGVEKANARIAINVDANSHTISGAGAHTKKHCDWFYRRHGSHTFRIPDCEFLGGALANC